MMDSVHYDDEIQDLLDGRLDLAMHGRVAAHVEACAECRLRRDALRRVKQTMGGGLSAREAPPRLRAAVAIALNREDRPRLALVFGLAAAAAAMLVVFLVLRRAELPSAAARDFDRYRSHQLLLEAQTGDQAELERFFARNGIPFRTRVFDLGMMNYRLAGGRVQRLAGRPSAFFVYEGPSGRTLVCQMYEGQTSDLPGGAQRREHAGIVFHLYRRDNLTEVFWQEGDVVCVLVSDAPVEETVALAFAKAMKA